MVSKSQLKLIAGLHQKKIRTKHGLFVAEGIKVINEYLQSGFQLHSLFATESNLFDAPQHKTFAITEVELKKMSRLHTPNKAVAIFEIPMAKPVVSDGLIVALDDVNDPGNLGTIIRLCDWFGISQLVCSVQTVDCYNPKVIQATMGSLSRVAVSYVDLNAFLKEYPNDIYAAMMDGENVYEASLPQKGVLVMGNEANGISSEILQTVTKSISIPRFGNLQQTESLNVATATAILLSEFKRR